MTIANKVVLVTGANRGIGRALVEEALRRDAKRVYAGTRKPFEHSFAGREWATNHFMTNQRKMPSHCFGLLQCKRNRWRVVTIRGCYD